MFFHLIFMVVALDKKMNVFFWWIIWWTSIPGMFFQGKPTWYSWLLHLTRSWMFIWWRRWHSVVETLHRQKRWHHFKWLEFGFYLAFWFFKIGVLFHIYGPLPLTDMRFFKSRIRNLLTDVYSEQVVVNTNTQKYTNETIQKIWIKEKPPGWWPYWGCQWGSGLQALAGWQLPTPLRPSPPEKKGWSLHAYIQDDEDDIDSS